MNQKGCDINGGHQWRQKPLNVTFLSHGFQCNKKLAESFLTLQHISALHKQCNIIEK